MTARDEVLNAAKAVVDRRGDEFFTVAEVITETRSKGTGYSDETISTHIGSRMCVDAPENHAVTYDDFGRADGGRYYF